MQVAEVTYTLYARHQTGYIKMDPPACVVRFLYTGLAVVMKVTGL